jgi:two-component system NtrC family sensor kinase
MEDSKTKHITDSSTSGMPRYRKLRRRSIMVTALVALIPLTALMVISYFHDTRAYQSESQYSVSRALLQAKKNIEIIVSERKSLLSLILQENSYQSLCSSSKLKSVLNNMNASFGGFVDLGIIDTNGIQINYVGPYDLEGKSYEEQDWLHEVLVRGIYVSNVFMGYRKLPHFVIAFKHELDVGKYFVLRATLDMKLLNEQIYSLKLDSKTDIFIINNQKVLQTPSLLFGDLLDTADIDIPERVHFQEVIREFNLGGNWVTAGSSFIKDTPFILMVIHRHDPPLYYWISRQSGQIWFFILSSVLILIVIFYGANQTVKRLRELDIRKAKVFHDIEYTNKMATIGRMAAGVAHEINNPLAIINEKAGLLEDIINHSDNFPHREKIHGLVNSITGSVDRCSKVTRRLLGFSKKMEDSREVIILGELIREVAGFMTSEINHRNIHVLYKIAADIPTLESDRGQLQQIFLNILSNAVAAVDNGGRIDIAITQINQDSVAVDITDDGVGISEDSLEHIFEPFYSTKGEFGTGLGLSITQDMVQKLGGRIEVSSEVGVGTTFRIILPHVQRKIKIKSDF